MAEKTSLRKLYQFYRPLVDSALGEIANLKSSWKKVVAMITATILFLLNRDITAEIASLSQWRGFSRWWALLPAAILFVYYLARANYQKFQTQVVEAVDKEAAFQKELATERDRIQQPDVALVWDWEQDEGTSRIMKGLADKDILIHNRSSQYIYRVQIKPVIMGQELTFEEINEIPANSRHLALAHWGDKSSLTTDYLYFFCNNEKAALEKGWHKTKTHQRGLSPSFLQVPMLLIYESQGVTWQCEFDFIYDPGSDCLFLKKSCRRFEAK